MAESKFIDPFDGDAATPVVQMVGSSRKTGGFIDPFDDQPVSAPAAPASSSGKPKRMMSASKSLGMGLTDILSGGAQAAVNLLPDSVVSGVNRATAAANELPVVGPAMKAMGMVPATAQQVNDQVTQRENDYQQERAATGESGMDLGRMAGSMIPATALAMTGALPAAGTALGSVGAGAAGSAMLGVGQPIPNATTEDYASRKGSQVGMDAAIGAVAGPVGYGIGRAISPQISPNVQKLSDEGVRMTPGQIMGGMTKRVEDAATSIPLVGDSIRSAQRKSIDTLNRAAINRALEPIGQTLPKDVPVGREAIGVASGKVSEAYDKALSMMTGRLDEKFVGDVNNLIKMAQDGLPKAQADRLNQIVKTQIVDKFGESGSVLGRGAQSIDSELGRLGASFKADPSADVKQLGDAVRELRSAFQGMLERVNPSGVSSQYRAAKEAFANLATVERAAGEGAATGGVFTPAQLSNAVKMSDRSSRRAAFSRGEARMQDLSDAARSVLPPSVPDSGTPLRSMVGLGLLGGGGIAINPAIPAAGLGVAGLYTDPAQRAIQALLLSRRPDALKSLGQGIASRGGALVAPAVAGGLLSVP